MDAEQKKAYEALSFIIPLLQKHNLQWVITGGFACYVYGVPRQLTDIDIDVNASKDTPAFKQFYEELKQYLTQPLKHFVDQNYDNYNFEVTIQGQVVDICPMAEMKVINKQSGQYENFYEGFPQVEFKNFNGLELPLLAKDLIIKNKEMLVFQRESDRADVAGLRALQ